MPPGTFVVYSQAITLVLSLVVKAFDGVFVTKISDLNDAFFLVVFSVVGKATAAELNFASRGT